MNDHLYLIFTDSIDRNQRERKANVASIAAHCFCNEVYNKVEDKSKSAIAVGKRYRDWNAGENYVEKSMLANISLPIYGILQDIALLLNRPFWYHDLRG